MQVIYLIGVDHEAQWSAGSALRKYLLNKVSDLEITFIAEEFSIQALRQSGIKNTISGTIAQQLSIKHILCDPDEKMRKEIGYPTQQQLQEKFGYKSAIKGTDEYRLRKTYEKQQWHIRESYWLSQIKSLSDAGGVFICGAEHTESFKSLLQEEGYNVHLLIFDLDASKYPLERAPEKP